MGKRAVIIIFLFLAAVIAVPGYFLLGQKNSLLSDPYSAIPRKASVIVETIDLRSLINSIASGEGVSGEIHNIEEFSEFTGRLKKIADELNSPGYSEIFTDERSAVIAFFAGHDSEIRSLLSMPVPDGSLKKVKHALTDSGINRLEETEIKESEVLTFTYSEKDTVFITARSGLILVSNTESLISDAFTAIDEEKDIREQPGFSRILLASGNNANKLFIIYDNLAGILKPYLASIDTENKINSIASAGGGDFYLNNDGLVLTGYSETSGHSDYFNRFKNIRQGQFHTFRILPEATAFFETVLCSNEPLKAVQDTGKSKLLASELGSFIGDEITRAVIDIKENNVKDNTLIIYELTNREMAEQAFLESTANERTIMWFEPDERVRIPIYKLSFSGLLNEVMPGFGVQISDSLFAFYENFLITGSSYLTISKTVYDNTNNRTLANDMVYREFEGSFPTRSGYFFYFIPSRVVNYLDGLLSEDLIKSLKKHRSSLNRIQAAGYQLSSSNGMIYNNLSVKYRESAAGESMTEWQALLDTISVSKPFFFTNHLTGAQEIFIQDLKNNVYLINAAGRILWKIPLREKIEGSVHIIDYYKNGKLQLLFNGSNYLHLLDRNGRYVENYPVKLKSPASAGLSLFDYESNRNYRIIIPGEDRLVYAYDKSGNPVKGWKPFRTAGSVRSQAAYYKVSGKDYIVVSDDKSLYLLDRYGSKRVTFREPVTRAPGSALKITEGSETYLTCTSSDGLLQRIYFDGRVVKSSFRKFSPDHFFDLADLNSDGENEYIFVDSGLVSLYNNEGEELFTTDLGSSYLGSPATFSFSADDKKIGIYDFSKKLIYLIDEEGQLADGFPLKGASMFSIGRLADKNSWNLIVGGPDGFLYNYKIDTGT